MTEMDASHDLAGAGPGVQAGEQSRSRLKMQPILKIKRLPHALDLPLPAYQTDGASGIDLYAAHAFDEDQYVLDYYERREGMPFPIVIATGVAVEISAGYEGHVRGRSGLAFRDAIITHFGSIDSDYRGEIKVALFPLETLRSTKPRRGAIRIARGDRIAQLVISPVARVRIVEVEELSDTARGAGGFGSTGAR